MEWALTAMQISIPTSEDLYNPPDGAGGRRRRGIGNNATTGSSVGEAGVDEGEEGLLPEWELDVAVVIDSQVGKD